MDGGKKKATGRKRGSKEDGSRRLLHPSPYRDPHDGPGTMNAEAVFLSDYLTNAEHVAAICGRDRQERKNAFFLPGIKTQDCFLTWARNQF